MGIRFSKRGLKSIRSIVFRVDANSDIGMGHYMRCSTIAYELIKQNWIVYFVGDGIPERSDWKTPFYDRINWIPFPFETDSAKSMTDFIDLILSGKFIDLGHIVIDSYHYSREDFSSLLQAVNNISVIVIDDIASRDTPAHMVINPNPLFDPVPYRRQEIPYILCGSDYTLIRPEVVQLRGRKYNPEGPLLTTLGGGNVIEPLMRVLDNIPESLEKKIIVSVSDSCPLDRITKWIDKDSENRFLNIDMNQFPKLLASCSMAITGGGTTLWEVYCLGIPSLAVVWVDNQMHTATVIKEQTTGFLVDLIDRINIKSKWIQKEKNNIAVFFGSRKKSEISQKKGFSVANVIMEKRTSIKVDNIEDLNEDKLKNEIYKLTSGDTSSLRMIKKQQALIDGKGALRIAQAIGSMERRHVPVYF